MNEEQNNNFKEEELPKESEIVQELQEAVKKLEKEREEYLAGWKRAKADLLNFQKETEKKIKEIVLFANENLILELLNVLDSLELAMQSLSEEEKNSPVGRGYYLIHSQLYGILNKHGLQVIEAEHQKFNPLFHEAVDVKKCQKENCSQEDDNLIIEVLAKGYLLNGKVIRPAKVKVISH